MAGSDRSSPRLRPREWPVPDADDPYLAIYAPIDRKPVDPARAALLVVDLQRLCAERGYGMFRSAGQQDLSDLLEGYAARLEEVVLPETAALAAACRAADVPVVYTRIESATPDGRDRSRLHKDLCLHAAPGSREAEIVDAVAPEAGDLVLSKTTSGAFAGAGLHELLGNLGVDQLMVCGVLTNECVENTVRAAADLGYDVTVVEDGCATVDPERHLAALRGMWPIYARLRSAAQLREELTARQTASA